MTPYQAFPTEFVNLWKDQVEGSYKVKVICSDPRATTHLLAKSYVKSRIPFLFRSLLYAYQKSLLRNKVEFEFSEWQYQYTRPAPPEGPPKVMQAAFHAKGIWVEENGNVSD